MLGVDARGKDRSNAQMKLERALTARPLVRSREVDLAQIKLGYGRVLVAREGLLGLDGGPDGKLLLVQIEIGEGDLGRYRVGQVIDRLAGDQGYEIKLRGRRLRERL